MSDGSIKNSGHATIHVDGLQYRVTANTFFQANRFLLAAFINEVIEQSAPAARHVLELYAGAGFFSVPLARIATEVISVESNRSSVRQGRENARMNETGQLNFVEGQVDAALEGASIKPDLVVLNPPRSGCGVKTAARISELEPARIVYVSCNPSTFALEAATLLKHDYRLRHLTLVDQFPNTYHIETVALFEK
jgi:23S rRNA (uracil1939-C5)-methyltransferase